MILKVEEYVCCDILQREDIEEAYEISKDKNILIKIVWVVFGTTYERYISPSTDIDLMLNSF